MSRPTSVDLRMFNLSLSIFYLSCLRSIEIRLSTSPDSEELLTVISDQVLQMRILGGPSVSSVVADHHPKPEPRRFIFGRPLTT